MHVNEALKSVTTDVGKDDGYCACSSSGTSGVCIVEHEAMAKLSTVELQTLENLFTL